MIAVQATDITRRFGELIAVNSLSLRLDEGEIFAFLGHNGAGKTTTIRLMNGVLHPSAGDLRVLGFDPATQGSELRRHTGVLTEAPSLDDRLTARENLSVYAHLYELADDEVPTRVGELLERFDLAQRAEDKVGGFSKGMKQRLAIARALIHHPRLLFLDEPTAGLDPMVARQVHELIMQLRQEGRTIIICTHNLTEAQRLCDRVAVLSQGKLVAIGSVVELSQRIGGGHDLELEVHPDDLALAMDEVTKILPRDSVVEERGYLLFRQVERNQIPKLVERLAATGVRVFRVSPQEPSLEDVYFDLHAGGGSPSP
jgi:ABC-2 type transport system ATP-binding protein